MTKVTAAQATLELLVHSTRACRSRGILYPVHCIASTSPPALRAHVCILRPPARKVQRFKGSKVHVTTDPARGIGVYRQKDRK